MDTTEEELAFGPVADRRNCSSFAWWLWLFFSYRLPMLGVSLFRRAARTEEDEPLLKA
jgi:hypothetical protein